MSENLALPLELEDARPIRFHGTALRVGCLSILAATAWAGLTPIRELAVAPGQILPNGDVRAVQHLEGGIVAEIIAKSGDTIKFNDPIIRLDDDQVGRDLAQFKARLAVLTLQKQQIGALLNEIVLELRPSIGTNPTVSFSQQSVFDSRFRARAEEGRTLESRIAQRRADILGIENSLKSQQRLVDLYEQSVRVKSDLFEKSLTSRRELLVEQAALEQSKGQLFALEGKLATTRYQLKEAESQFAGAEADARRQWSEEVSRINTELLETTELVAKLEDRMNRLTVRSMSDGVVQSIQPRSIGEVI